MCLFSSGDDGETVDVDAIAQDVRAKLGGETIGVIFPILSRNRFAICLRGIAKGAKKVIVSDLARVDMSEAVEDAFRYSKLVLATTTYNGDIFPFMKEFIHNLTARNFQNRTVAFIENGTWAPNAGKVMKSMFEKSKNITFAETQVTVKSAVNEDAEAAIDKLADELLK